MRNVFCQIEVVQNGVSIQVGLAMSYSALISREGLPLSHDCTICRLNASS